MQQNLRDGKKDTEVALAQRDTILQNILDQPRLDWHLHENMVYQACNKPFVNARVLKSLILCG